MNKQTGITNDMAAEDKLREYLKRVTVELTDARKRLADAQARQDEPIAVVGMACRFPGADSVADYWDMLSAGRDGVLDDVPDGRFDFAPWVAEHGVYTTRGAFLSDITRWDARFFGFPPREALRMDPQQRLLMELAWEAMEDAGAPPPSLAGSRTGVIVGFSDTTQYAQLEVDRQGAVTVYADPYTGQGSSASVVAGRLAYHYDLRGPALALDTACSSSLVAVHMAADALRRGECDLAVAGGAFLAMQPYLWAHGCATSMLSRAGRCATFDAAADGYLLGEGGGLVVLARLSDALASGRRIRAVIRGSAVNQDGRSNGLTAPNRGAQIDVIRRALAAAKVSPDEVGYVEAHGSGTPLGDEIELGALNEVFGGRPATTPLRVGAVKTNVGHTQAAAGIAGFIKTVLVLENGTVPPNLNLTDPAEAVLASETVRPVTDPTALADGPAGAPALAGVSSFGWSGTNAHLVLAPAPGSEPSPEPQDTVAHLLPVSAADDAALRAQLTRLAGAAAGTDLADLAYTLHTGRAALDVRRAVVVTDPADAAAALSADAPGVRRGKTAPAVAFAPPAAGRVSEELYRTEPVYAGAVDRCVEAAGRPLGAEALLDAFTAGYALAALLDHVGPRADTLVGPIGELVSACRNGRLTLDEALDPTRLAGAAATGGEDATDAVELVAADRAGLLAICGRLWELGATLDWTALRGGHGRLAELPGYPFQRERYWIDPPATTADPAPPAIVAEASSPTPVDDDHVTLLVPRWTPAPDAGLSGPAGGRYLLVADATGVADALADRLGGDGADVVVVPAGATLPEDLAGGSVVDLSALDLTEPAGEAGAVLTVSGTLAACGAGTATTRVLVVTRGGQAVAGTEAPVAGQAAVAVLPVVANQEYLNVDARGVDLDPDHTAAEAADALAAELARPTDSVLAAHRGAQRYVPGFESVATREPKPAARAGGSYLITGGLGDIGLAVAEHLVAGGAARIILTSRGGLPADPADPRAVAVARMRAAGAEVDTPRVDVTDADAMRALFTGSRVDGVVHAAADTSRGIFQALRDLDGAGLARGFAAKVGGARVLAGVLAGRPAEQAPAWCVLFSSTSARLGGVTFGGYAAANAALTALAHAGSGPTRWVSAEWDTWACTLDKLGGGIGATMLAHSMTDAEALAALDRLVSHGSPAVVVAAGGLSDRLPRPGGAVAPATRTTVRHPRPDLPAPYTPPLTATERTLAEVWTEVVGVEGVGTRDNFFDLGGTSLLAPQLFELIHERLGVVLPTVTLFEAPTVHAIAAVIDAANRPAKPTPSPPAPKAPAVTSPGTDGAPVEIVVPDGPELDRRIAIVGMAGRFPGAAGVAAFWRNLCDGVESITFFSKDELVEAGVDPALADDPAYVPARPILDDITGFDAAFFGMSPRMAALTDPQQRLFLEVCWEALEQAGYCQPEHRGRVGVFGGTHISTYLMGIQASLGQDVSQFEIAIGNEKDALTTNVSYLFDLHGPSVAVQTFCSTSLVAAHLAVQSLRAGDCETALAGGVSIRVPDKIGHRYEEGGMESPDGHVRTFDAKARGAMFGDGASVVVLKRLSDALRDGDHIWGVIRGSAMNNDGSLKVGYTAPSVTGQAAVVSAAMADAGVAAEDIGYVEAHGSGTPLGDPIEVAALTQAFGPTQTRQYCPIGSVKTNVGHLDRAAGTTGLIKTTLALHDRLIPPTLHFTTPNPEIDFAGSPFYVNTDLLSWQPADGRPRVAGVNSLGMGGTNVHMVVTEPPGRPVAPPADPDSARRFHVLPVSARTAGAADESCRRLGEQLATRPDARLADVAYTLQVGRKVFEHRRVCVADTVEQAAAILCGTDDTAVPAGRVDAARGRPVALLLAGVGEQYPGMVGEMYRREPVFRELLDDCLRRLAPQLPGVDLEGLLTGERSSGGSDLAALLGRAGGGSADARSAELECTEVVQPLMFAVDYALAGLLRAWGLRPAALLGYSLGEYVAACLAGVLSLDDALALVVHRAKLIATLPAGAMLAVGLSADELRGRFAVEDAGLDVAAVNGPSTVVVAGPPDAVARLTTDLRQAEVPCRPLRTTHAFHSRMLAPIAGELTAWIAANVTLNAPSVAYVSNVTGELATAELVCDPGYWARHMCQTVRFSAGADVLLADPELAVVEVGPGQSLTALVRTGCSPNRWPLLTATLPAATDPRPADEVLTDCLSRLWLTGVDVDWATYHGRGPGAVASAGLPGRVPLPTYPFERQRFWIEPAKPADRASGTPAGRPGDATSFTDLDRIPRDPEEEWLYLPVWRQTAPTAPAPDRPASWLVYTRDGAADRVLAELGAPVIAVRPGERYTATADGYTVRPGDVADTLALLRDLRDSGTQPERVTHLWTLDAEPDAVSLGLHTLVALARAAGELGLDTWALDIVTAGTQPVLGGDATNAAAATLTGPALVIPLEYPSVTTRLIDAEPATPAADIAAELSRPRGAATVALRAGRRWTRDYETVPAAPLEAARGVLRDQGVYLITGGLGGIGLGLAEQLARDCAARLVLFGRSGLPPRDRWAAIADGTERVGEAVRDKVRRILELIGLGAEVEVVAGDVSDPADVRRAVGHARQRFGALHGVLHAAGVPGNGLMQFKEPTDLDPVLAPKVAGSEAIAAALGFGEPDEAHLDFLVLFSSIASATGGGPGQVDYCGANAYLDAFAAGYNRPGRRVLSVGWGEWTWNGWDDGLAGYDQALREFFTKHRGEFGITMAEGWRSLLRALASGEPHLVVSTQDLPTMVRFSTGFTVAAANTPAGDTSGERHARPELVTPFQEPVGDTEERIADTWCRTLRLDKVGAADNFFELGGNSLLGITLLGTLRGMFTGADLPPHTLYEAPTVAALAKVVDAATGPANGTTGTEQRDTQAAAQLRRMGRTAAAARRRRS